MNNYAYITLLSSDNYFYYILALYDSLISTKPKYPLYCCVTEEVSEDTLDMMDKIGLKYIHISTDDFADIINQTSKQRGPKKYIRALGKLAIFNLTQFSKCVYLDSDLIIRKNIDDLFDRLPFTAVEDCLPVHKRPDHYVLGESSFNSGMFVYEPSAEYYNKILETIPKLDSSIKWHDQAILAYLNQDWMQRPELQLPYTYNTLVAMQEDVLGEIKRLGMSLDDIKVYHYVTYKNAPYKSPTQLCKNVYNEYYDYFVLINDLIDKYGLNIEKTNLQNVQCKNENGHCIDLVVPYVDSSDPEWLKLFNKYSPNKIEEAVNAANRFRSNDVLFRYFFRCIDKNMPWIDTVHLLVQSESQVPEWINKDKVHIVYHRDFIPEKYLPTFNSTTIEMFLWNIPELKEEFLYANDDFYILKPSESADWLINGKTRFNFKFVTGSDSNIYMHHTKNVRKIIDGVNYDEGFVLDHTFKPYYKSRVKECYNKFKDEINSRLTKFRDNRNVNCYLFSYYDYINGYQQTNSLTHEYYSLSNIPGCVKALASNLYATIVINDNCINEPSAAAYDKLIEAFKKNYAFISKYEIMDYSKISEEYLAKVNNIISKCPDSIKNKIKSSLLKNYIP